MGLICDVHVYRYIRVCIWRFPEMWGPILGCPYSKTPTIVGSTSEPLILENHHMCTGLMIGLP